jgi:hypothetical protein
MIRPGENYYLYGPDRKGFSLPDEVIEWAGLDGADPHISMTREEITEFFGEEYASSCWDDLYYGLSLAGINDEGIPFSKIAQVIDRKL